MSDERNARLVEAIAFRKQCHARDWSTGRHADKMISDAAALMDAAAAIRERGQLRWHSERGGGGNLIGIINGSFVKIIAPLGRGKRWKWKAWDVVEYRSGIVDSADEAKLSAMYALSDPPEGA